MKYCTNCICNLKIHFYLYLSNVYQINNCRNNHSNTASLWYFKCNYSQQLPTVNQHLGFFFTQYRFTGTDILSKYWRIQAMNSAYWGRRMLETVTLETVNVDFYSGIKLNIYFLHTFDNTTGNE